MEVGKEYNLFDAVCMLLNNYTDSFENHYKNFVTQVHGKWATSEAYPTGVLMNQDTITVTWSDGFSDQYSRTSK